MNIIEAAKTGIARLGTKIVEKKPEIMLVAGAVGIVAGTVMMVKKAKEAEVAKEEYIEQKEAIAIEFDQANYDISEDKKEKARMKKDEIKAKICNTANYGWKLTKTYGPGFALEVVGMGLIFGSHAVMKSRYSALASGFLLLSSDFAKYRSKVVDLYGEEIDSGLAMGIPETKKEIDENGEETEVIEKWSYDPSSMSVLFGYDSVYFMKDPQTSEGVPEMNLNVINNVMRGNEILLKRKESIALNDIIWDLDGKRTKDGQVLGYKYNPEREGENQIEYAIYPINDGKDGYYIEFFNLVPLFV